MIFFYRRKSLSYILKLATLSLGNKLDFFNKFDRSTYPISGKIRTYKLGRFAFMTCSKMEPVLVSIGICNYRRLVKLAV